MDDGQHTAPSTVSADEALLEAATQPTPATMALVPLPLPVPGAVARTRTLPASRLGAPFTLWATACVALAAFVLVCLGYSVAELLNADWAAGARVAAITAFALAALAVAGTVLRWAAGRRALSMLALALLLVAILAGAGLGGLSASPGLHRLQARTFEQSGQYEAALHEYALAGNLATSTTDSARVFDEWAESLLHAHHYADALARYLLVSAEYQQSGAPYTRALAGIAATYSAWIAANTPGVPYPDATAYLRGYATSAACDTGCQAAIGDTLARAAYQFGVELAQLGQYDTAIQQLSTVQTQYPHSQFATLAHGAAATTYLKLGKQQLMATCSAAVTTYQTLAKQYADTPEGASAKKALAAPQSVNGRIVNLPGNPLPTIYLSRSADPNGYSFSNDYHSALNAKSGTFSFSNVPQGTYVISAVRDLPDS
ncbi:MAG: tol-pal system YbgF family protein, partial [Ktedonobacterales bacterium]